MFIDVDTGDCGFSHEPAIFTSLGGLGSHWTLLGTSAIYSPTDRGFTLYLYTTQHTVANANSSGWHVNWARVDSY
jgi:hypothetical protein